MQDYNGEMSGHSFEIWGNLWPTIPDLITPQRCWFWAQAWAAMHEAYICMCVCVCVCIYKTHNQWWSAGVWENVRKQQLLLLHVSGHCADVWATELKAAMVRMLWCQCCGSARGLWLASGRRVNHTLKRMRLTIAKIPSDRKSAEDTAHKNVVIW